MAGRAGATRSGNGNWFNRKEHTERRESGESGAGCNLVLHDVISVTYPGVALVAQVSNLLCRGFPIRKRRHVGTASDWKSGIQQVGNLRYVTVFEPTYTKASANPLHRTRSGLTDTAPDRDTVSNSNHQSSRQFWLGAGSIAVSAGPRA